jgi:hypothetical protein
MKLGLDFGNTIVSSERPIIAISSPEGQNKSRWIEKAGASYVVSKLIQELKPENVFIVSKATANTAARTRKWLEETGFYERTCLSPENVFFCETRAEKAPLCERLGLDTFVDDRPEVMAHLKSVTTKILFDPNFDDLSKWRSEIRGELVLAAGWFDVARLLDQKRTASHLMPVLDDRPGLRFELAVRWRQHKESDLWMLSDSFVSLSTAKAYADFRRKDGGQARVVQIISTRSEHELDFV